jgi:hypothetical protein
MPKKFGGLKNCRTFAPLNLSESGMLSIFEGYFFAPQRKGILSYPYPCVLAVMAHKLISDKLSNRKGGYFFLILIFMLKLSESQAPAINGQRKQFNLLNLPPQNEQGIGAVTDSGVVGNNCNEQIGHTTSADNSDITGDIAKQDNHVQENLGVTGITGTGHTINIYQYLKEIVELLKKLQS